MRGRGGGGRYLPGGEWVGGYLRERKELLALDSAGVILFVLNKSY